MPRPSGLSALTDTSGSGASGNSASADLNLLPSLSQIPLPNLDQDATQSVLDEFNKLSLLKQPVHEHRQLGSNGTGTGTGPSGHHPSSAGNAGANTSILSTSSLNDSQTNPDVIFQSDRYYMPGTASLIADVDKLLMVRTLHICCLIKDIFCYLIELRHFKKDS